MKTRTLQSIFEKYPKAGMSFDHFYVETHSDKGGGRSNAIGFIAHVFYKNELESQIGYILAWMRSEYWINFEVAKGRNSSEYSLTLYTGQSKSEYIKTDGEFNTAFLSLTEEFCKRIEK